MIRMFIVIITGKDITMEKDITAGRLDITVPETEAAGMRGMNGHKFWSCLLLISCIMCIVTGHQIIKHV